MQRYIYDQFLKRDVTSIFDPKTLGHEYSERERQVMTLANFDILINGIKDFIQEYFLKNFDMSIPNFSFFKRALKE